MNIDYVTVTEQEIADGEYNFSVVAFDNSDCEVEVHEYRSLSAATDKAESFNVDVDYDLSAVSYARL